MSDIYSLGSVIFFIISGDKPWKEKKNSGQISIELSNKATPTRPEKILNVHWNSIQKCWSWEPKHRPESTKVLEYIKQFGINDSQVQQPKHRNRWQILIHLSLIQASISNQPVDLTGQIIGQINSFVAGGTFANVYRCECKQASGRIKVRLMLGDIDVAVDYCTTGCCQSHQV
ncbi:hypothetical protein BDR03DRAFT_215862 [Suillus americanus]|nr:hypothetical protein BDR03DRAFT_215862 [Suillus americanus]